MIVKLNGILIDKSPSEVVIDVHGIGYLCFISDKTYMDLSEIGDKVSLFIHYHVTENSHSLYGFSNINEKKLFLLLVILFLIFLITFNLLFYFDYLFYFKV